MELFDVGGLLQIHQRLVTNNLKSTQCRNNLAKDKGDYKVDGDLYENVGVLISRNHLSCLIKSPSSYVIKHLNRNYIGHFLAFLT